MRLSLFRVLLAASGLFMLGSAEALAADVANPSGNQIIYLGEGVEANDLVVTETTTDYVFTDPGANITPGPGCAGGGSVATCTKAGVTAIEMMLGEGGDSGVVVPAIRAIMRGGNGDDELTGGDAADLIVGQGADDSLAGEGGADEIHGEDPTSAPGTGENSLDGGAGDDELHGGEGLDFANGGTGNDDLFGAGDVDELDGDDGSDFVSGGDGNDVMRGGDGGDTVGDDAELTGSPSGLVPPERGDDQLEGGGGDDVLRPGPGPTPGFSDDDTHSGGPGFDSVVFEKRTARVEASLDAVANDGGAGESDNVTGDVERLVGGQAGDLLAGGPANDTLDGFRGADTLRGGGGGDNLEGGVDDAESDSLAGGDGGDSLRGSGGDDMLTGDAGTDTLAGDSGADNVQGGADSDQITGGPGPDTLAGGAGPDQVDGAAPVLLGADGADTLNGDEGNDSLRGGAENDRLQGGDGSDDMRGEAGRDAADYGVADRAVRVSLDGRANDGESAERDNVRTDVENVDGGGVEDTFTGSGGRNRLNGGAGEDYVDGRRGADELLGGASVDVVRARDGRTRDSVSCGRGKDFAIVSRRDRVRRDCEAFDNGIRRVPRVGAAFVVSSLRGANGFGPPGMRRTVPLVDRLRLPMASQVDATKGRVSLTSARGRGRQQKGVFSGGRFQVRQRRSAGAFTELRLRGGDFSRCEGATIRGASRGAVPAQRRIIRRLRARARGTYRAAGRHSAGSIRGTSFEIVDRCDGTLTRVFSGVVRVRDFRRRRTITVRAGKSYLARAR